MSLKIEGYLPYNTTVERNEDRQIYSFDPSTEKIIDITIQGRNKGGLTFIKQEIPIINKTFYTDHKICIQNEEIKTIFINENQIRLTNCS